MWFDHCLSSFKVFQSCFSPPILCYPLNIFFSLILMHHLSPQISRENSTFPFPSLDEWLSIHRLVCFSRLSLPSPSLLSLMGSNWVLLCTRKYESIDKTLRSLYLWCSLSTRKALTEQIITEKKDIFYRAETEAASIGLTFRVRYASLLIHHSRGQRLQHVFFKDLNGL